MNTPIVAGTRAYWRHHCTSRRLDHDHESRVLVLQVRLHTAKISIRKVDGRFKERWVKLTRLSPVSRLEVH